MTTHFEWFLILVFWIHMWWKHVLMKIQIKMTMRYHFTPTRLGKIVSLPSVGEDAMQKGLSYRLVAVWISTATLENNLILCSKCLNTLQPSISLPRCTPCGDSCIGTLEYTWEYSYQCSFFLNPHPRTCLLILERGKGRKKGRGTLMWERNISWLPFIRTLTGTEHAN